MIGKNVIIIVLTLITLLLVPALSSAEVTVAVGKGSVPPGANNVSVELSLETQSEFVKGCTGTYICGDVYPGGDNCGDGEVDLFDVIEAIDIALGIGTHSNCQLTNADVPTGTPPNCRERDGVVDIFDIVVIIDKALGKPNCCDYTTTSSIPTTTTTTTSIPTTTSSISTTTSSVSIITSTVLTTTSSVSTTTSSLPTTTTTSQPTTTSSVFSTTSSVSTTTTSVPTTTTSSRPTTTSSVSTTTTSLPTTTTSSRPTTTSSVFTTTSSVIAPCNTKIYRGGVCADAEGIDDPVYNRPGRRGLSITCCEKEQFCVCSSCDPETLFSWTVTILAGSDPDFTLDDLVASEGIGETFSLKVKDPCTEYCPDEIVKLEIMVEDSMGNVDSVIVTIGKVALGLSTTNAYLYADTAEVDLLLWNPRNFVRAIQTDVCSTEKKACEAYTTQNNCTDFTCGLISNEVACVAVATCQWRVKGGVAQCVNKYNCEWVAGKCLAVDNLVCNACVVDEDRTPEFICSANEQADGCCRITLFSTEPDDLIQRGNGAVARIYYGVLGKKTSKDCITLVPINSNVADQFNEKLCACLKTGDVCFTICGDVYPQDCYECESCGDGRVDLFDILEEIDIILGLQTASLCQMMCGHGNVPLGIPPYCGNPAGVNPPNCQCDGAIDIFDALVIIDKALSKMNCCDYCMFGNIY